MVSGRQRTARNWRWLCSDKKTCPTLWWRSGRHFEAKWFWFEEAFIFFLKIRENWWATCGVGRCVRLLCMRQSWRQSEIRGWLTIAGRVSVMWAWHWRKGILLASYRDLVRCETERAKNGVGEAGFVELRQKDVGSKPSGFLRCSEFTIPALHYYEASKHLSFSDISVDSHDNPTIMAVR